MEPEQLRNISELVESCGAHLVDARVLRSGRTRTLDVSVDTETGVSADQLADISRALSDAADRIMGGTERYILTVGSPGLEVPLQYGWQFRRHHDRPIHVVYNTPVGRAERDGAIRDCDDGTVSVQTEGDLLHIPLGDIIEAKIQIHV